MHVGKNHEVWFKILQQREGKEKRIKRQMWQHPYNC